MTGIEIDARTDPRTAVVVGHPANPTGTLRTAAGRELPVQACEQGEEVVLIVLSSLESPPAAEDLDPATLEYTSSRGVVRLHGEAHFEDSSLVRFRAEGEPEVIQRRAFVRVHTPQEVRLTACTPTVDRHAYTIDLSGGGMLLSGAPMLSQGDAVAFEVRIGSDAEPIRGVARVVRAHSDGRRALAFEQISETERQRLIRFVFTCMRASRAKTRGDLV